MMYEFTTASQSTSLSKGVTTVDEEEYISLFSCPTLRLPNNCHQRENFYSKLISTTPLLLGLAIVNVRPDSSFFKT